MTKRLNQVLAIEGDTKNRAHRALTNAHHDLAKPALLEGLVRTYEPADEGGETFPPESKRVQVKAPTLIEETVASLVDWWNIAATKERGNAKATADIIVDGEIVLADVPVTYLLFLEKRLVDLRTFIGELPTLDIVHDWTYDVGQGVYVTPPVKTAKTKKVPRNHVKAEATDKHPAQVEVYFEDIVVGSWERRLFSGALSADDVAKLTRRVSKLQDAVKVAREAANTAEVDEVDDGKKILDYLFA